MTKTTVIVPVQIEGRGKKGKWVIGAGEHSFTGKQLEELDGLYVRVKSASGEHDTDNEGGGVDHNALIVEAIGKLDDENPEHFTDGGLPRVSALESIVKFDITEAQRDAAWNRLEKNSR